MKIEVQRYTAVGVVLSLTPESEAEVHQVAWIEQRLEKMDAGAHKANDGQVVLQLKNFADCPNLVRERKLRELRELQKANP